MKKCCVKFRTVAGICVAAAILALFAAVFAGCGRKTEAEPPFYPEFTRLRSVKAGLEVHMDFVQNYKYTNNSIYYPDRCTLDVEVTVAELEPAGETDFGGVPIKVCRIDVPAIAEREGKGIEETRFVFLSDKDLGSDEEVQSEFEKMVSKEENDLVIVFSDSREAK